MVARLVPLLALALALAPSPGAAETLRVGPGERFARPSQAAAAARAGDTVQIAPGLYEDCAIWRAPDLTIAAAGTGAVVITGPVCGGKALFVTAAPRITITGITFRGAISANGNGAGIRAEGGDLTIRRSRFEDNENGILTAPSPQATLLIEDSLFLRNGALRDGHACAHGLYVGGLGRLIVRRSTFEGTRVCHHVKSRAGRTEITDSRLLDTPEGNASYLLDLPNGGDLVFTGNTLRKGPRSGNPSTAIAIGLEGVSLPTTTLSIRGNSLENLMRQSTLFVRNRSTVEAVLEGNRLTGPVRPLEGAGTWR